MKLYIGQSSVDRQTSRQIENEKEEEEEEENTSKKELRIAEYKLMRMAYD
jgi:hypothetical protein